jgi:hypothetical protein
MSDEIMEHARVHLKNMGRNVTLISHRIVSKYSRTAHVFKGKEGDKTVRFLAIPNDDGPLGELVEITTTERKYVGATACTNIVAYRQRQATRRADQKSRGRKLVKKHG